MNIYLHLSERKQLSDTVSRTVIAKISNYIRISFFPRNVFLDKSEIICNNHTVLIS